ncbi:hypothetical protein Vafri_17721 [Volvox africanus]|uniref:DUF2256 domain-containing protein n=1 Tax=Volvox africanus TaxID=51714 RepID=A0A8J4BMW6_9CHLO|nr:hypothetical protein Vafri_17721 [Volvox africanus]
MPRGVKKEHLPTKVCVTCGRPFTWRKVWEKCWDEVQCCSDRCKNERKRKLQLANRELRASGAQDADCTAHASPDATPTSDSKAVASTQHDLREAAACFEETPSSLKEDGAPRSPLLELPNDAMLAILHRMDAMPPLAAWTKYPMSGEMWHNGHCRRRRRHQPLHSQRRCRAICYRRRRQPAPRSPAPSRTPLPSIFTAKLCTPTPGWVSGRPGIVFGPRASAPTTHREQT